MFLYGRDKKILTAFKEKKDGRERAG